MQGDGARIATRYPAGTGGEDGWFTRTFRRVTTSGRYIPEIDGLRFVALASVFLVHLGAYLRVKSTTRWVIPWQQDWLWQLVSLLNRRKK